MDQHTIGSRTPRPTKNPTIHRTFLLGWSGIRDIYSSGRFFRKTFSISLFLKIKTSPSYTNPMSVKKFPKSVREEVWMETFGKTFSHKCSIAWCKNEITVFHFHFGPDQQERRKVLRPICSRCNLSLTGTCSFSQLNSSPPPRKKRRLCCFFFR